MAGENCPPSTSAPLYSPLSSKTSIRLLELFPGLHDDDVSCKLHTADLSGKPKYTALSYVWGDPTDTVQITCNGQPFHATKNLAAAMRRLRDEKTTVACWIDAICINQADLDERGAQVRIMQDIYRSADQVAIYLGEVDTDAETTNEVVGLISVLYQLSQKIESRPGAPATLHELSPDARRLPQPQDPVWDHFQDFFRRAWFSRIWVLQECIVASADPIVICGGFQIPWSVVGSVAAFFHETGLAQGRPSRDLSFHAALMHEFRGRSADEAITLFILFKRTRKFRATDPRDKLFALSGIAADMAPPYGFPYFAVDYRKPVQDVYRDATRTYLSVEGKLDLFGEVGEIQEGERVSNLPSWVPDFSGPSRSPSFGFTADIDGYAASANFKACFFETEDPNVLRLAGQIYDTITWVSSTVEDGYMDLLPEFRQPGRILDIWQNIERRLGPVSRGGKTTEAFWRTMVANVTKLKRPLPAEYYIHFLSWWRLSRAADLNAEEHVRNGERPVETPEIRRLAKDKAMKNDHISTELYAALQRKIDRDLAEQGIFCTKPSDTETADDDCIHCLLRGPEGQKLTGIHLPPVRGSDPTLALKENDPFLTDYFDRLLNDREDPIPIIAGEVNMFAGCLPQTCIYRSFFVTENGYLGLGPGTAKVGDKVAIFAGGRTPFLLRQTNVVSAVTVDEATLEVQFIHRYRLLGEAYVHGLMKGEAVRFDEQGRSLWSKIDLM